MVDPVVDKLAIILKKFSAKPAENVEKDQES